MYCKKCEVKLDDNVSVCPTCGTKVKLKRIIRITILTILGIILLIVFIIFLKNNYNSKVQRETLENEHVEITTIKNQNNITFAGFTFKLPTDLQYSNTDKYIYATPKDFKFYFKMNVILLSYDNLKEEHEKFVKALVESGIQIISYNILEFDEHEHFLVALNQENKQYLYTITKLNTNYAVQSIIESPTESGYEEAIGKINTIIKKYEKLNADLMLENIGTLDDFLISYSSNSSIGDLFKTTES